MTNEKLDRMIALRKELRELDGKKWEHYEHRDYVSADSVQKDIDRLSMELRTIERAGEADAEAGLSARLQQEDKMIYKVALVDGTVGDFESMEELEEIEGSFRTIHYHDENGLRKAKYGQVAHLIDWE